MMESALGQGTPTRAMVLREGLSAPEIGDLVPRRLKSSVISREAACEALAKVGELERQIEEVNLRLEKRTAKLQRIAKEKAEALSEGLDQLKRSLWTFTIAHPEFMESGTKTIKLTTGSLRLHLGNLTTHVAKELEEDPTRLPAEFRRTKVEVDREALRRSPELASLIPGVWFDQTERLHMLPDGLTTEIGGPSRKIRYNPKEDQQAA